MQTLSQDGRWLPVIATSVDPATQADIHVLTLIDVVANTTDSRQIFSSQPTITSPLKFAPDGKNVAYRVVDNGTDNIWMQPVDGSQGHPVTHFTDDHVRDYAWSPDGKNTGGRAFPCRLRCHPSSQRQSSPLTAGYFDHTPEKRGEPECRPDHSVLSRSQFDKIWVWA